MDAIFERVYQEPAKVARVRASREARRNGQEPTEAVSQLDPQLRTPAGPERRPDFLGYRLVRRPRVRAA